jgi:rhamnulokinase
MNPTHHIAIDLGAESGRVVLGTAGTQRISIEEVHRFPNTPLRTDGGLHWDIPALFDGVRAGLAKAAARKLPVSSVSCDSWGLDYVLLDAWNRIIEPVFHYRDARTRAGVETVLAKHKWEDIFAGTGIQFMPINTLFQLAAEPPERLSRAAKFLLIGDAFLWMLSGAARAEVSLASTTQLCAPRAREWSPTLLKAVGLPANKLPPLVSSGARLGKLLPPLAKETGLGPIEVIATCSHDTAAAVAAVPVAQGTRGTKPDPRRPAWAYISSGTWSLMGVEVAEPVITDLSRSLNFTNEIGYANTVRLLKNLSGLWLVQECRRSWARAGKDLDYAELTRLAAAAKPLQSLIHPTDPRFLSPADMPAAISEYCEATGQPAPGSFGAFVRCCLESLALLYRKTLREIELLTDARIGVIHVVGGGSKNDLLNQFTANACGVPVRAGPGEATALGNVLVQAITLGTIYSLEAARDLVLRSSDIRTFAPRDRAEWGRAAMRFDKLPT